MRLILSSLVVSGMLAAGPVSAQTSDILSLGTLFKRVVSTTAISSTSSTTFVTLASTEMAVPAGMDALITARFSAESRCTESGGTGVNWCEVRILIDGVEANPVETSSGQDFAFDSTDSGNATSGDYEAHSMDRHRCVRNTTGTALRLVPVVVEWKVTNLDGGSAPSFWIDDSSLTVEANKSCIFL